MTDQPISELRCYGRGKDVPRALRKRHLDASDDPSVPSCPDPATCRGCLPCRSSHCLVCRTVHKAGVCPECLGKAREDLAELVILFGRLSEESLAHPNAPRAGALANVPGGVSLFLSSPAPNPDTFSYLSTYALHREHDGGVRDAAAHLADDLDSDGETPSTCVAWWAAKWRLDHGHEPVDVPDFYDDAYYVNGQLSWAADNELRFDDLARDLTHQRTRIEDALSAGERDDTGAPCMKCNVSLVRMWGDTSEQDVWACPRCKQRSSHEQYKLAVRADFLASADALSAPDLVTQYGVSAGSVRGWASLGKVRRRGKDANNRLLYDVADVLALHKPEDKSTEIAG